MTYTPDLKFTKKTSPTIAFTKLWRTVNNVRYKDSFKMGNEQSKLSSGEHQIHDIV